MKKTIIISAVIALTGFCLGTLSTCKSVGTEKQTSELQDTIFLSQWKKEKQARLNLIHYYEIKTGRLEKRNDSLTGIVILRKQLIATYRLKQEIFQQQLKEISFSDTLSPIGKEKLNEITDSLIISSQNNNAACDTTIYLLEEKLANRDSSLTFYRKIESNLREEQKDQEQKNLYLTEQLNTAFKEQRKKARQNKLLTGGLLILSGITTSVLISNSLK